MGINFSSITSNDLIINDIKKSVIELIDDYKIWTDKQLCNNFELIYNGKLINLTTQQLKGITSTIGYYSTESLSKDDLCIVIMNHYKKRITLLQLINKAINKCNDMINRTRNGNICINVNKFIDDFYVCNQIPNAKWISKDEYKHMINNLKTQNRFHGILIWIEGLDEKYNESLRKLSKIIVMIREDIDKTIDEIEFGVIEKYTQKTLTHMILICEIYYLLAINYK